MRIIDSDFMKKQITFDENMPDELETISAQIFSEDFDLDFVCALEDGFWANLWQGSRVLRFRDKAVVVYVKCIDVKRRDTVFRTDRNMVFDVTMELIYTKERESDDFMPIRMDRYEVKIDNEDVLGMSCCGVDETLCEYKRILTLDFNYCKATIKYFETHLSNAFAEGTFHNIVLKRPTLDSSGLMTTITLKIRGVLHAKSLIANKDASIFRMVFYAVGDECH